MNAIKPENRLLKQEHKPAIQEKKHLRQDKISHAISSAAPTLANIVGLSDTVNRKGKPGSNKQLAGQVRKVSDQGGDAAAVSQVKSVTGSNKQLLRQEHNPALQAKPKLQTFSAADKAEILKLAESAGQVRKGKPLTGAEKYQVHAVALAAAQKLLDAKNALLLTR